MTNQSAMLLYHCDNLMLHFERRMSLGNRSFEDTQKTLILDLNFFSWHLLYMHKINKLKTLGNRKTCLCTRLPELQVFPNAM